MARVVYIDATQKLPGVAGPRQADVYTLWCENPSGLRTVIYGTRQPTQVLPHDHASRRGAPLEEPLLSVSFGPTAAAGSAVGAWAAGVPMYPPNNISFVTTPKLMGFWRTQIHGGIDQVSAELLAYIPAGATDVDLVCHIRPLSELGVGPGEGGGASVSKNWAPMGSAEPVRTSFNFTDLSAFGDPGIDREVLVELWLTGDPDGLWRLYAFALLGTAVTDVGGGEPLEYGPPRAQVDPASLQTGQIMLSSLAQQGHLTINQASVEAMGRAPGLSAQLLPDIDQPFERTIRRRHRHTGRSYVDPISGEEVSDGAIPRLPFAVGSPFDSYSESASQHTTANPATGPLLHPTNTLTTTAGLLLMERRLEAPPGVTDFETVCMIAPKGTSGQNLCRLWWYFQLVDLDGSDIDITIPSSGGVVDPDRAGSFTRVRVDPRDGLAWQPNAARIAQGLGLWTNKAIKSPLPSTVRTSNGLARVSRTVRISYTPIGRPVRLRCYWALEVGAEGSAVYDTSARLCGWDVWPAPGF